MAIKHTYRTKHGTETRKITAMKAIRLKCLDCSYWINKEVELCEAETCPIWPFRFGNSAGVPARVKNARSA